MTLYANIEWEKAAKIFSNDSIKKTLHEGDFPSTKDILRVVAGAGAIGLCIAFPQGAHVIAPFVFGGKSYSSWRIKKTLSQLSRQHYVSTTYNSDGSVTLTITKEGMSKAMTY